MKNYIKKILYLILIICITFIVNAQQQITDNNIEKVNIKKVEIYYEKNEIKEKETNIVRARFSESFKDEKGESPEKITKSYLKENHVAFGISEDLNDIKVKSINITSGGKYVLLEQHLNNIPVYAATATATLNNEDVVTFMVNNLKDLSKYNVYDKEPKLSEVDALNIAKDYLNIQGEILLEPITELIYFESMDKGLELSWKINILASNPYGDWFLVINATDKRIIHVENVTRYSNGSGKVYKTNPLQKADKNYGDHVWENSEEYIYEDNDDANSYILERELETASLQDITYEGGKYKLKGPYCILDDIEYPKAQFDPEYAFPELTNPNGFNYTRNQLEFESVMVYYHIDQAGRRVESLLGYLPSGLAQFKADPHGCDGQEMNLYHPDYNYAAFGDGGVDGGEDAEIIWHEYGHGIQNKIGAKYNYAVNTEPHAVDEGTSDYWACSYTNSISPPSAYKWGKFADWEMHNEYFEEAPYKNRWVDRDKTNWGYDDYDDSKTGHYNGQIWSSALIDVWKVLGRDVTDRLVLEAILHWDSSPTMHLAAAAIIDADFNLYNGQHICSIVEQFYARGLTELEPGTETFTGPTIINRGVSGCDVILDDVNITNNTILHVTAARNVTFLGSFQTGTNSRLIIE